MTLKNILLNIIAIYTCIIVIVILGLLSLIMLRLYLATPILYPLGGLVCFTIANKLIFSQKDGTEYFKEYLRYVIYFGFVWIVANEILCSCIEMI